jgi:hypothetical protein
MRRENCANRPRHAKLVYSSLFLAGLVSAISLGMASDGLCQTWVRAINAPARVWNVVASSADGSKLVAATDASPGGIYTSTDSGVTWTLTTNSPLWLAVASSADGVKLAAGSPGFLLVSTNSGAVWHGAAVPFGFVWNGVTMSADAAKLAANGFGNYGGDAGPIYYSGDSGTTWTSATVIQAPWSSIAASADGRRMVAASNSGLICGSQDFGATWTTNGAPIMVWKSVASSADGTRLVAVVRGNFTAGPIYISTNAGTNWFPSVAPSNNWAGVVSSADGTSLVAVVHGGGIYTSTNSGATWDLANAPSNQWTSVASSADGRRLVAVESGGGIYTLQIPPPALSIVELGTDLVVSWTAGATGFVLQSTPDLRTTSWVAVTNPPTVINGTKQMLLPNSARTNQFYRLSLQ